MTEVEAGILIATLAACSLIACGIIAGVNKSRLAWMHAALPLRNPIVRAVSGAIELCGPTWRLDRLEVWPRGDVIKVTITIYDKNDSLSGYKQNDYLLTHEGVVEVVPDPETEMIVEGGE